jgi:hypothetical protein
MLTESQEQAILVRFLRLAFPREEDCEGDEKPSDVLWFHVPSGAHMAKKEAAKMKRLGMRRGIPDIIIIGHPPSAAEKHCPGMVIELKMELGGMTSKEQHWCIGAFEEVAFLAYVCPGADSAITTIGQAWRIPHLKLEQWRALAKVRKRR